MTAKEMFEELGYKQIKHNVFDEPPKPNTFVTQDEPYILYKQDPVKLKLQTVDFELELYQTILNMKEELKMIKKSKSYRLGYLILWPIKKMYSFLFNKL